MTASRGAGASCAAALSSVSLISASCCLDWAKGSATAVHVLRAVLVTLGISKLIHTPLAQAVSS